MYRVTIFTYEIEFDKKYELNDYRKNENLLILVFKNRRQAQSAYTRIIDKIDTIRQRHNKRFCDVELFDHEWNIEKQISFSYRFDTDCEWVLKIN